MDDDHFANVGNIVHRKSFKLLNPTTVMPGAPTLSASLSILTHRWMCYSDHPQSQYPTLIIKWAGVTIKYHLTNNVTYHIRDEVRLTGFNRLPDRAKLA
jgi:hypothetical protein